MLRRIDNPPNPFDATHREWLEEPPPAKLEVYEERAKSILSTNDSPDISFNWSINPYRGCMHACAYCYARPYHEYLGWGAGTDFDSRIVVKINAGELLETALAKRKTRGEPIAFSGITDCYQPLEAVYRVTRACLEACERHGIGVSIVTKSFLIARDAELLAAIARQGGARIFISLPIFDEAVARKIEPGAPTPQRRIEALRRLSAAGVPVGVLAAPIIPGLNDRDIPRILESAAAAGARWAGYTGLRLPGSVRPVFLERLREALPDSAARVEARIRDMRSGAINDARFHARMQGQGPYWESIEKLFESSARKCGLLRGEEAPAGGRGQAPIDMPPPPPAAPPDKLAKKPGAAVEKQLPTSATGLPGVVQLPLFPG